MLEPAGLPYEVFQATIVYYGLDLEATRFEVGLCAPGAVAVKFCPDCFSAFFRLLQLCFPATRIRSWMWKFVIESEERLATPAGKDNALTSRRKLVLGSIGIKVRSKIIAFVSQYADSLAQVV